MHTFRLNKKIKRNINSHLHVVKRLLSREGKPFSLGFAIEKAFTERNFIFELYGIFLNVFTVL